MKRTDGADKDVIHNCDNSLDGGQKEGHLSMCRVQSVMSLDCEFEPVHWDFRNSLDFTARRPETVIVFDDYDDQSTGIGCSHRRSFHNLLSLKTANELSLPSAIHILVRRASDIIGISQRITIDDDDLPPTSAA